jgi:bacterioferritin-associated ferredoxin
MLLQSIRINAKCESMIVCVCNAIREKDLRSAVRCGNERAAEVYARLGRKPKCGQCIPFAQNLISVKAASA